VFVQFVAGFEKPSNHWTVLLPGFIVWPRNKIIDRYLQGFCEAQRTDFEGGQVRTMIALLTLQEILPDLGNTPESSYAAGSDLGRDYRCARGFTRAIQRNVHTE